MRLLRRLLIVMLSLIAIAVVFVPPLIGFAIEKFVGARMLLQTIQNNPDIRVISYNRHWFTTDITVALRAKDSDLRTAIAKLAPRPEDLPDTIEIILTEHFQHGPVFYHPLENIPYHFGLALVDRKLIIPDNEKLILSLIGLNESIWKMNHAYISFTAKIFEYLELANFDFEMRSGKSRISFDSMVGNVWIQPLSNRVSGLLTVNNLALKADKTSISLPLNTLYFNLQKDAHGLWIGRHALELSKIILLNTINDKLEVVNVKFDGFVDEKNGLLEAEKGFSAQRISFAEQDLGPFNLQISADRINATGVVDLIETYKKITHRGELYESQLRQQLMAKLPYIVSPGTSIQLDNLVFATPVGNITVHAKMQWPTDNFTVPGDFNELIDSGHLQASLRIATQLTNHIIQFFSKLIYIREIPDAERNVLLDLENQIQLGTKQAISGIDYLIQTKEVPGKEGNELIKMVRNNASSDEYNLALRKMYLDKIISRDADYQLTLLYSILGAQVDQETQTLKGYQQATEQDMHKQFDDYLKQGYVAQDKDDYVVSLERDHGQVKLNGHVLPNGN